MAHPLREKAAISGVGDTAYTRGTPKSALALQLEASLAAVKDPEAGKKKKSDSASNGSSKSGSKSKSKEKTKA